jgi:hypothetical protein
MDSPSTGLVKRLLVTLMAVGICFLPFSEFAEAAQDSQTSDPFVPEPEAYYVGTDSYIDGLWHAYSPTVLDYKGVKRMWIGGWLSRADEGSDVIYYSEQASDGKWAKPVPSLTVAGYAVNDPTVIKHPREDWLFMYFTLLSEEAQKSAFGMVHENKIGFASSIDAGRTWTFRFLDNLSGLLGAVDGSECGLNLMAERAPP